MSENTNGLRAEIDRLSRELASERARTTELETTVEQQAETIDEQNERIDELEAGRDIDRTDGEEQDDRRSSLAQLIDLPKETATDVLTENQERARSVAQRAPELGTKAQAGLVIKSADVARRLRERGESDHDETVRRVMDFVAEFGQGDVEDTTHKGKRILVFDPDRVREYGTGEPPERIVSPRDVISLRESDGQPAPA